VCFNSQDVDKSRENLKKVDNFDKIIHKIKKILKVTADKKVAEALGMTSSTFNNRKKRNSIPYPQLIDIANSHNVNLEWLFNDVGPVYKEEPKAQPPKDPEKDPPEKSNITKVIIEHQKLLTLFKDQERAKEINENLIEIEQLSDELMENIAQHIKSSLTAARIIRASSKKKSGDSNQDTYQNGKSA
jgi:hypothetical protein